MNVSELKHELKLRAVKVPRNATKEQLENLLLGAEITEKPVLTEEEIDNRHIEESVDSLIAFIQEVTTKQRHKAGRYNSAIAHLRNVKQVCKL